VDIQAIDNIRKNPKQNRAKVTVDSILEATIQLLEGNQHKDLTTNHIAERAGVSVGTLYQYFSNRDEILTVLFFTYRRELVREMSSRLEQAELSNLDEAIHSIIHILIGSFKSRLAVRSAMVEQLLVRSHPGWTNDLDTISALIQTKLESFSGTPEIDIDLNPVGMFVLTRSVFGVVQRAIQGRPEYLDDPEFEKQLTRLVWGFLKQK
jgi:AcrR family transcriptional regulator